MPQINLFKYFFLTLNKAIFEWLTLSYHIPEIIYDALCEIPGLIHDIRAYLNELILEKRDTKILEGRTIEEWKNLAEKNFAEKKKFEGLYFDYYGLRQLLDFEVEQLEVEIVERDIVIETEKERAKYWAEQFSEYCVYP